MFKRRRVYFDAAAGAVGNPSSPHQEGREAREQLERARVDIARLLEVQSDDIIFTSGATESNALAILGHVRALRARAGKDAVGRNNMHVLYLPSAHASIVENVKLLAEEGVQVEALPIKDWRVDIEQLATMLRPETVLVTMEAVCGETGVVWNTREVAQVIENARDANSKTGSAQAARPIQHPVFQFPSRAVLHVDASQAVQSEKLTRARFGADLLTLDGAKVGVRGIGLLVSHRTIPLVSLYRGGGQERELRPGSENPEAAEKFAAALRAAADSRDAFRLQAENDRSLLIQTLLKSIPGLVINKGPSQASHILNISLPARDTDYLVALLDEAGFAVSTKSACETDSEAGSRAVFALTGDAERARSTLRISWSAAIHTRELARFSAELIRAIQFIDTHASG